MITKTLNIAILLFSLSLSLGCSVSKNNAKPIINNGSNFNIIEGIDYPFYIENSTKRRKYFLNGHGLSVNMTSELKFNITAIKETIHYLEIYEISKFDTILLEIKHFNVLPIPHPVFHWGEFDNRNGLIKTTKEKLLLQNQVTIDSQWQKSTNLRYEIESVELQSKHTSYYNSFKSNYIPERILKDISEYSGENKIIMALKVKCPDGITRVYSLYHNIIVID